MLEQMLNLQIASLQHIDSIEVFVYKVAGLNVFFALRPAFLYKLVLILHSSFFILHFYILPLHNF